MALDVAGHLGTFGDDEGGRVLSGPCQLWTDAETIRSLACFDSEISDSYDLLPWARFATVTLWRLSGRQRRFAGLCSKTMRPMPGHCGVHGTRRNAPALLSPYPLVRLVDGPVYDVTSVVIDGTMLDSDAYRLVSYRELWRVDGHGWPGRQDLSRKSSVPEDGDTDPRADTWQVTYRVGQEVQHDAQIAASVFAAELAMARCGSTRCRLPQRYWQKRIDPLSFVKDGKTGIPEVDVWLQSVNPEGIARRAKLSDPREIARRRGARVLS